MHTTSQYGSALALSLAADMIILYLYFYLENNLHNTDTLNVASVLKSQRYLHKNLCMFLFHQHETPSNGVRVTCKFFSYISTSVTLMHDRACMNADPFLCPLLGNIQTFISCGYGLIFYYLVCIWFCLAAVPVQIYNWSWCPAWTGFSLFIYFLQFHIRECLLVMFKALI